MAERQTLGNSVGVRLVHLFVSSHSSASAGTFALEQMPLAGVPTHDFAIGGNLEPLGHRLLRFNTFGASHNFIVSLQRAVTIGRSRAGGKAYLLS